MIKNPEAFFLVLAKLVIPWIILSEERSILTRKFHRKIGEWEKRQKPDRTLSEMKLRKIEAFELGLRWNIERFNEF